MRHRFPFFALFTVLLAAGSLAAQERPPGRQHFYQFAIDQDRLSGAPDFSFLNHPIGPADRLFVRDGHFYRVGRDLKPNTADDERVRVFGMNLAFGANFPEQADARRVARRLRRLGVNLVRLHHMDTTPDAEPARSNSLLTTGPYPTLNPVAVARLRAFLDACKAEGIYANLNLAVGYQFRPAEDDVPAMPGDDRFPSQSKPLRSFFPRMIDLQANFARAAVEALRLNDDPVLAMVEIDNENSLLYAWQSGQLDREVRGPYRAELRYQWNRYLEARYGSTGALVEAWTRAEPDGPALRVTGWSVEGGPAEIELLKQDPAVTRIRAPMARGGVIVAGPAGALQAGQAYYAAIEVRVEAPERAVVRLGWQLSDDRGERVVASRGITATSRWQRFTMLARADSFVPRARLELLTDAGGAALFVRGASLRTAGLRGLTTAETLDKRTVEMVGESELSTEQRLNDFLRFLVERDRFYLGVMLKAVRETAGPLAPVTGTQMGYGGLLNLDSHADLDYLDNHFYVDHYNFPNVQWDGRDWRFRDVSAVAAGLTSYIQMALARPAGRPYTVSEFNQPWPNRQAAESDPTLAAFAAFQDWDGLVHFAYSHGRNWDAGVPNGFNVNGDWSKFANIGQSAWLFRTGAVQPGRAPVDIPLPEEWRLRAGREKRNWSAPAFLHSAAGLDPSVVFLHRVRLAMDSQESLPGEARQVTAYLYESDTGELTYDRPARLFLIDAPRAAGIFGAIGQSQATAGPLRVELAASARGFGAFLLTSLDERPLPDARRMLLSAPGYTLRSQPGAGAPRPQPVVNYPGTTDWWTIEPEAGSGKPSGNLNGGEPPVWMERVEAYLMLNHNAPRLAVYPLDGKGARLAPLPAAAVERVYEGFRIHLQADGQHFSPWYELVAGEAAPAPARPARPARKGAKRPR